MTLACLRSVLAQHHSNTWQIIVVDNASSDGSAEAIVESFPDVRLIRSAENLGFARANNLAARHATGECLLLLNPDTVVLDGAIDKLLAFAKAHPQAGIWGGRTLFEDGSLNPRSCWHRLTVWGLFCAAVGLENIFPCSSVFNQEAYGGWNRVGQRQVDIVSGCFFLIRRVLWESLGGFDGSFFMYGEEADLCLRGARIGVKPMVTSDATIIHHGGASTGDDARRLSRLMDSKARLIRRHWPGTKQHVGLALLRGACILRATARFMPDTIFGSISRRGRVWHQVRRLWRALEVADSTSA